MIPDHGRKNRDQIYNFIEKNIVIGIIIIGLIVAGFMLRNYFELREQKSYINSLMNWKSTTSVVDKQTGEIRDIKTEEEEKITPDTIRELEVKFNKARSEHEVLAQIIPIFPLLGILGTVAGLIRQLSGGDINVIFQSLDTAMTSTFWGLVFAILLKFVDAILHTRAISDIEIIFENYEKKFDNALKLKNIAE